MINNFAKNKIIEQYGIDIINDVLLADDYHVVFCFDFDKKDEAEVTILAGDVSYFGLNRTQTFRIKDIISLIEVDNPVSEVIGKENYIDHLFSIIEEVDDISEIYFAFKGQETKIVWVVCSLKRLKTNIASGLIYGRVNWVDKGTPDAVKLYEFTYKDTMTKLFSREALIYHLSIAPTTGHSYGLYFDIDNFKRINDVFGHKVGDKFLLDLANLFNKQQEENIVFYRIGGDEFFVYMKNVTEEMARKKALKLIYEIERLNCEGQQVEVSASVGIVPIIGSNLNAEKLLDLADRTMYHAKSKGKGNISYARDV